MSAKASHARPLAPGAARRMVAARPWGTLGTARTTRFDADLALSGAPRASAWPSSPRRGGETHDDSLEASSEQAGV